MAMIKNLPAVKEGAAVMHDDDDDMAEPRLPLGSLFDCWGDDDLIKIALGLAPLLDTPLARTTTRIYCCQGNPTLYDAVHKSVYKAGAAALPTTIDKPAQARVWANILLNVLASMQQRLVTVTMLSAINRYGDEDEDVFYFGSRKKLMFKRIRKACKGLDSRVALLKLLFPHIEAFSPSDREEWVTTLFPPLEGVEDTSFDEYMAILARRRAALTVMVMYYKRIFPAQKPPSNVKRVLAKVKNAFCPSPAAPSSQSTLNAGQ